MNRHISILLVKYQNLHQLCEYCSKIHLMPFSQARRGHTFFMVIVFACLGVTTEVVFTAISDFINNEPLCGKSKWALAGSSYVWMIFVYGLIPLIGHYIHERVRYRPIWQRLLLYVGFVYVIEFTSGLLLRAITGHCPWEYTTGWHIMGLIRLDYLPAWLFFCFMIEQLYIFINKRVVQ